MKERASVCFAPLLDAAESRLIECYRRSSDIARQQLVDFAELYATLGEPLPDNVIPFPQ